MAEIILARLRLSPSVFGGSPHWPFIFCFWALTGFVFGWLFAAKSLRVRLVVFFLLAGLVFLYRLGAIEFKKGLRESMSAGAEYLKNDAASLMAIFKESDEKRMK
ncbi:MAG: hypothetical protein HYZ52_03985 [Candidatus Omnitrophica bacterium]|nr:hypothetical protein [Candidatus Omnitrophota bacterium]